MFWPMLVTQPKGESRIQSFNLGDERQDPVDRADPAGWGIAQIVSDVHQRDYSYTFLLIGGTYILFHHTMRTIPPYYTYYTGKAPGWRNSIEDWGLFRMCSSCHSRKIQAFSVGCH